MPVAQHSVPHFNHSSPVEAHRSAHRITLVIHSLGSGGAERVLTTMANAWANRGHTITIVTMDGSDSPPFFPLADGIELIRLGHSQPSSTPFHATYRNATRIRALRQACLASNPVVVIAFMDVTNVTTLLALMGTGIPVVVTEHTDPGLKALHPAWQQLRSRTYPRADQVVVLSHSARDYFPERIRERTVIQPNPVPIPDINDSGIVACNEIVAMGRLVPEKGFDQLLAAFSLVADRAPDWSLVIWGEGPERARLELQRDKLGLENHVRLPGITTEPHDRLRQSSIFALPSRREGFPMALAEALACGLAAVAFDISSGVSDILRQGRDGLLVTPGDIEAFAAALLTLIQDEPRRQQMAAYAPEVLARFGVDSVMDQWDRLLADVIPA